MTRPTPLERLRAALRAGSELGSRDTRSMVERPADRRRFFLRAAAWFLVSLTLTLVITSYLPSNVRGSLLGLWLGVIATRGALSTHTRATSYRHGYVMGRLEMVSSLREAALRGMSMHEWAQSQYEADQHLFKSRRTKPEERNG